MSDGDARKALAAAAARIGELPNVVGYGRGVKIVGDRMTSRECLTVFVRRKPAHLPAEAHIPPTVDVAGKCLVTDVVKLGKLRLEGVPRHVRHGTKRGMPGLYAATDDQFYVVSCCHVLTGSDSIRTPAAPLGHYAIECYAAPSWRYLGNVFAAQNVLGQGTPTDWGAFDAGLAQIDDPEVRAQATALPPAHLFDHRQDPQALERALLNEPVYAIRGNRKRLDAQVLSVHSTGTGAEQARYDLLIRHPEGYGLTRPGDSGIVWRLLDSTPLAMHLGGHARNSQRVSTISVSFFVGRITQRFHVECLAPPTG